MLKKLRGHRGLTWIIALANLLVFCSGLGVFILNFFFNFFEIPYSDFIRPEITILAYLIMVLGMIFVLNPKKGKFDLVIFIWALLQFLASLPVLYIGLSYFLYYFTQLIKTSQAPFAWLLSCPCPRGLFIFYLKS